MAYRRRTTRSTRYSGAGRGRGYAPRSGGRRRSIGRGATRRAAGPAVVRLELVTQPASPVTRPSMGLVPGVPSGKGGKAKL